MSLEIWWQGCSGVAVLVAMVPGAPLLLNFWTFVELCRLGDMALCWHAESGCGRIQHIEVVCDPVQHAGLGQRSGLPLSTAHMLVQAHRLVFDWLVGIFVFVLFF